MVDDILELVVPVEPPIGTSSRLERFLDVLDRLGLLGELQEWLILEMFKVHNLCALSGLPLPLPLVPLELPLGRVGASRIIIVHN